MNPNGTGGNAGRRNSGKDGPARWIRNHLSESGLMLVICGVVGISAGLAAVVLKWLVKHIGLLFVPHLFEGGANFRLLIYPLAGILLTSIYQRYITHNDCSGGTGIMKRHLLAGNYDFRTNSIWNSIIGCSFTIGFGASAGTEGPVAYSGGVIGAKLGKWFGLTSEWIKLLIGIGAGAGIAGIFKAPLGGSLFALEVLRLEMSTIPVLGLVLACLLGAGTAEAFSGFSYDMPVSQMPQFDVSTLGWVAALAVISGFYSLYYNFTKDETMRIFEAIDNPWIKNVISGIALALPLFLLPPLFGEGTGVMADAVNGEILHLLKFSPFASREETLLVSVLIIGAILLLKGALVSSAYYGGGVSGDFMPTLFSGCLLGYLFAIVCNALFGATLQPWYFAMVGMGAVMAGILQAPLMALFIAAETTGSFRYIPAYIIAVIISFAVAASLTRKGGTPAGDETAVGPFAKMPALWGRMKNAAVNNNISQSESSVSTGDKKTQGQNAR